MRAYKPRRPKFDESQCVDVMAPAATVLQFTKDCRAAGTVRYMLHRRLLLHRECISSSELLKRSAVACGLLHALHACPTRVVVGRTAILPGLDHVLHVIEAEDGRLMA